MLKFVFSFLAIFGSMHAYDHEMCVTVDRSTGTYTVDQYGCVPTGIPAPIPAKK